MKRGFFQTVVFAGALLMVPQYMNAEGPEKDDENQANLIVNGLNQQSDLLEETIKETSEVVEVVVEEVTKGTGNITGEVLETVDPTVTDTSFLLSETATNLENPAKIVNETTGFVDNTVQSTKSLVSQTTQESLTKSTGKAVQAVSKTTVYLKETLENTTQEVIKEAPSIPVVTPVLEEVEKRNKTGPHAVESVVDKPVTATEKPIVTPNETVDDVPVSEIEADKETIEPLTGSEIVTEIPVIPSIKTAVPESMIQKRNNLTEIPFAGEDPVRAAIQRDDKPSKVKDTLAQDHQEKKNVTLTEPLQVTLTPPLLIHSSYSSTPNVGVSDGVMGVLLLESNQIGLSKVWWNQGNKFALKQWIYDPLGQPPRFTPFLN